MSNNQALAHEKLAQATAVLDEFDVDAWLTFARETSLQPDPSLGFVYDGDVTWASAFLVFRDGRHVALVGYYDAENVRQLGAYSEVFGYHQGIAEPLRAVLAQKDPQTIAINYSENDVAADGLTHGMYLQLLRILEGTPYARRLISAEQIVAAVRGRKSPAEIERVRRAVATTELLFDDLEQFVRVGMTQSEIAEYAHSRIDAMGLGYAWPKPYNPIVTCGPDSPVGHAAPGEVVLKRRHTLHMDMGVQQDGYCSDIQRMWYVLEEGEEIAPPEVQQAFEVVLSALRAGEQALRPGVPGWQVDAVARQKIVDHGYPEYMHAFGHLLGRVAHDGATVLGPQWERYAGICERLVEEGNIFTLELHVNVPGRGVMSLEEDVLVTAEGVEYLSKPQTALRYIRS